MRGASYPVDIHNPAGIGQAIGFLPGNDPQVQPYDIPYGCLVPESVAGLLVAGRCISGSHAAMASSRVQVIAMATGIAAGTAAADLAVWYMLKDTAEGHGTKWLPDLRQWWRKSGRNQAMPVDGVTGPTRPAGRHALSFDARDPRLAGLAPVRYCVVVDASREFGGRVLPKTPFDWPATAARSGQARGRTALGAVALSIKP